MSATLLVQVKSKFNCFHLLWNCNNGCHFLQKEMLAKDREFNALSRFGDKLLRSLSQDEKVVLAQRLSEVNQRWKALQVRNNLT